MTGHSDPPLSDAEPDPIDLTELSDPDAVGDDWANRLQFTIRRDLRKRLDVYLQHRLRGISRSKVKQLIECGGVRVNEALPKPSTTVHRGDVIDLTLPAPALRSIEPQPIDLEILYEDDDLIVLNKQAGLIVHPARSHLRGTLLNGLAQHFKQQAEAQGRVWSTWRTRGIHPSDRGQIRGVEGLSQVGADDDRPGIIHRLDKNTTGVMVVAKRDAAHWRIARQFEDRTTLKAYLAVVHGEVEGAGGAVEQPLGKHPTVREAIAVRHDSAGRHALTLYRVRERYHGYTLVELELKTGRTHQIRVHMSYIGHPLVGDIIYGGLPVGEVELDDPPTPPGARTHLNYACDKAAGERLEEAASQRDDLIMRHPALHAAMLRFVHPTTQQPMTFTAPVHEPLLTLIRQLRHPRKAPRELGHETSSSPVCTSGYWIDLDQAIPDTT